MKTFIGACLIAVTAAATLSAQTAEPMRPGWTFRPSFTMGGALDDNVLLVGPGSNPPADYVTAVTPAGTLTYLGKRLTIGTAYQGSFVFYQELSDLNSVDQSAIGDVRYRVTPKLTLFASQSFASSPATDGVEFIGIPFRRIGNERYWTTGGAEMRLTPRTTLDGTYNLRFVNFDDNVILAFPGGHEHVFTGNLRHWLNARVSLGGTYGFRRVLIIDDPNPVMIHYAAGTGEYRLSEKIQISGSVGLSRLGEVELHPAQTGLAWRAEMDAQQEHFTTSVYYERSMVPSFGFGGTFQNQELAGTISGGFARNRAYWQGGAAWRNNDPLLPLPALPPDQQSLKSIWLTSRVGYRLTPWLNIEGYFTRVHQDSWRTEGAISRNRVGFQIVTAKPLRIAR